MWLDPSDDKSTLVQVMAWCHQATSDYLSQCWHISMSPNGVTRPQWVNQNAAYFNQEISLENLFVFFFLNGGLFLQSWTCSVSFTVFLPAHIWLSSFEYQVWWCGYFQTSLSWQIIVRRAGLLWSQQDFEWRWSVPLFKCLTVLEFSFILFDLCLLITFFNFIKNYVPIVIFWIFTYHKIWILSIMFCFIWSYWIIYFLACLEVSWRVVS